MWGLRVQSPLCYRLSSVYTVSTIFPEQDFSVWPFRSQSFRSQPFRSRDVLVWGHFDHDTSVHK